MIQVSKGFIPRPDEFVTMQFRQLQNIVGFVAAKTFDEGELQRIEPELRGAIIARHMDVRRLEPVGHVEEETKTTFA
ncbi:MAG: hypothetical protein RL380_803 [Verrucomicrobiota bacterium]